MKEFYNLELGAKTRLTLMKAAAAKHNVKHPVDPVTWRKMRAATYGNYEAYTGELGEDRFDDEPVWYTHTGPYFKREEPVHELAVVGHTGWFTDDGYQKAYGIVVRLAGGKFLAGYYWSSNGERVYMNEVYKTAATAAKAADGAAETFAETCREDFEKSQDAYELQNQCEELEEKIAEQFTLRNLKRFPLARERAKYAIEDLREKRKELKENYSAYV